MTSAPDAPLAHRLEIIGDPPREVRATDRLDKEAVRALLTEPSRAQLLDRLDITGADRADLEPLIGDALADAEVLAEITRVANLLRAGAGLDAPQVDLEAERRSHDALQARLAPGTGLVAILALAVSTSTVRRWHALRGLGEEQSWEVLADLGQQMRVHRRSSGRLGLHQLSWMALNWRGRLMQLGRLQFDLHRADPGTAAERWVIGTHIPARGPLDPAAVEDSFRRATAYFGEHFADLDSARPEGAVSFGHEFLCDSWLMNRILVEELGADSNIGAFVDRWAILRSAPGADSAAFFVFGALPPYEAAELPRGTRLERVVGDRLADGRGWETGVGRLVR